MGSKKTSDETARAPRNNRRRLHAAVALAALLLFLVAWTLLLRRVGAVGLVERIGVRNGYLLVFLIASAGGLSTFTSVALYTTVATLAAGGLQPALLGLFAGTGLTIGDSLFFLVGLEGRRASSGRLRERLERMSAWFERRPEWALRLAVFLYAGLTPFPNDVMVMTVAASGVRYRLILPSLLAGNLVLATLTALVGEGFSWAWFG
ncbi:MAG TPA: hypothetical protein VML95_12520 [Longimicrobiales bacterium]|nr:hypothetical protein [Longimicrobiales bacterium]